MFDFRKTAQKETLLSEVMVGREKLSTDDVIGKDWTIVEFGFAPKFDQQGNRLSDDNGVQEEFGVVVFAEAPDKFYCAGNVLTKVCKGWAAYFDGDPKSASEELRKQGGVKVRFTATKTKKGNNLTAVEIL